MTIEDMMTRLAQMPRNADVGSYGPTGRWLTVSEVAPPDPDCKVLRVGIDLTRPEPSSPRTPS